MITFLTIAQVCLGTLILIFLPNMEFNNKPLTIVGALAASVAAVCFLSAYHLYN